MPAGVVSVILTLIQQPPLKYSCVEVDIQTSVSLGAEQGIVHAERA